jgi:hypothetical protein
MSFTPARGGLDRSYDLVRQSLLQSDNLPFSNALTAEQIEQAFAAEGVSFGDAGCDADEAGSEQRGTIYTMGVTLWAMLSQALLTDVQRVLAQRKQEFRRDGVDERDGKTSCREVAASCREGLTHWCQSRSRGSRAGVRPHGLRSWPFGPRRVHLCRAVASGQTMGDCHL